MQISKTKAALVAALFGIAATGSILTSGARLAGTTPSLVNGAPIVALAADHDDHGDKDDENDGDHKDHGKHKGWYKHNQGGQSIVGTIQNVNGNLLNIRLRNGQYVTVNDQNALNNNQSISLNTGEYVRIVGTYGNNGQFYANRILSATNSDQYGNNGGYNNGYPNGNNNGYPNGNGNQYPNGGNNCNANSYNGATETITGYETSGLDGNGRFQLVTQQSGIPIPGQTYTIVTNNQTCFATQLGNFGKRLHVIGYPSGDGRTIKAIRIST